MPNIRKIPADLDLAERARFYGVCERTVRRWHDAGANVRDPESVGTLLLKQKAPSTSALETIIDLDHES
jgi:hypothetical protein